MSLPYDSKEQLNVALAEDAFRQVINHESQHLYQQQQNVNGLPAPTLQSMQPIPQEQSFGYNQNYQHEQSHHIQPIPQEQSLQYQPNLPSEMGQPTNSPNLGMSTKSDDIRSQLKNINDQSTMTPTIQPSMYDIPQQRPNIQPSMYAIPQQRHTRQHQRPNFQPSRNIVNTSYNINRNIRSNLYNIPISNKDEENNWLTILIVFIASFLLLSCK